VPIAWREVTAKLRPDAWTVATLPRRLARLARDPWEGYARCAQRL
jgi:bifunctional non-homologous end joining protein LigD